MSQENLLYRAPRDLIPGSINNIYFIYSKKKNHEIVNKMQNVNLWERLSRYCLRKTTPKWI